MAKIKLKGPEYLSFKTTKKKKPPQRTLWKGKGSSSYSLQEQQEIIQNKKIVNVYSENNKICIGNVLLKVTHGVNVNDLNVSCVQTKNSADFAENL